MSIQPSSLAARRPSLATAYREREPAGRNLPQAYGSPHLWLALPPDHDEQAFVSQARVRGVAVAPSTPFSLSGHPIGTVGSLWARSRNRNCEQDSRSFLLCCTRCLTETFWSYDFSKIDTYLFFILTCFFHRYPMLAFELPRYRCL